MRNVIAGVMLVAALSAGCAWRARGGAGMSKDAVVYVASKVRTMDPNQPVVGAFAVDKGRFVAVGTREQVLEAVGAEVRVVELGAMTVVPGLEDAHAHLFNLGRALSTLNLTELPSVAAAVEKVRTAPEASFQGEWLVGRGWDQNDWPELKGGFPDRRALDAVQASRPVVLTRIDGHAVWVNSEALRRAEITRDTPDPAGGRIVRDSQGEPTGVLIDNALDLVTAKIPAPSDEERRTWLMAALTRCAEVGLTAIHDAGMDLATFTLLQQWDALGQLPLKVYVMADGHSKDASQFLDRGPFEGRRLALKAVKFWSDGALGSRGAAMHAPYSDEPTHSGLLLLTPEDLEERARAFMTAGFQVNIHAIGDRANTLAIDVLSRVSAETNTRHLRHRIEHAQILRLEDIAKMKSAGLIASVQPTHATSDMPWAETRVGAERLQGAYAWRRLVDAGVPLALGSDFPIELPDPLHGIYSARTRQDPQGNPPGGWLPDQRLTGEEALRGFTTGAAYAANAEKRRGSIAVGYDADFVVLPVDPVEGDPLQSRNQPVSLTVVDGQVVYRR